MTFLEWFSLSDSQRQTERQTWQVLEPGYWHAIATEAAAQFAAEYGSTRHVTRVVKSLFNAEELIIAVQTDLTPPEIVALPEDYAGFKVVQFAGTTPGGVIVDVGPPSSMPAEIQRIESEPPAAPMTPLSNTNEIVRLEGEIDLHLSPHVAETLTEVIVSRPKSLIVDLSKVVYMDSSGLAVLIDAMRQVEFYGGKFYLVGLGDGLRVVFETSRLDQAFRIFPDANAALASAA